MKRIINEDIYSRFNEDKLIVEKGQEVTVIACELDENYTSGVKVTVAEFETTIDASFLTREN
jgi:hypothetical protein